MSTKRKEIIYGIVFLSYLVIAVPLAALPALIIFILFYNYPISMVIGFAFAVAWIFGLHYLIKWPEKHGI